MGMVGVIIILNWMSKCVAVREMTGGYEENV